MYSVGCPIWYPWRSTLRASIGITSSGETFWRRPAMRKKDRNGPGMITLFSGCEEVSLCSELSAAGKERFLEVAEWAGAAEAAAKRPKTHKNRRRKRALITDPSPPPGVKAVHPGTSLGRTAYASGSR